MNDRFLLHCFICILAVNFKRKKRFETSDPHIRRTATFGHEIRGKRCGIYVLDYGNGFAHHRSWVQDPVGTVLSTELPTDYHHISIIKLSVCWCVLKVGEGFPGRARNALGLEFGSAARLSKSPDTVWNCLWGNALKRSPGIIRKSRVL